MSLASVDGELMPVVEATIPATDEGLLRGDGVFEVVRVYAGRPFALDEHLARLGRSAARARLAVDVELVRAEVEALLAAAVDHDGLLRVALTRGGHRLALLEPLPQLPHAIRLGVVSYSPTRVLTGIKTLSYGANVLATRLARERGFDEALLVTPHGRVLEAPTSSFFWVAAGTLCTPPLDDHILDSITRARVLDLCDVEQRPCTLEDIAGAEEAFLASTVREVRAVATVEDVELPVDGPHTRAAGERLRAHIEGSI